MVGRPQGRPRPDRRRLETPGLPGRSPAGDRAAYALCLLEQFHRHLKHRNIFAPSSSRWRDPRAHLLSGQAWERTSRGGHERAEPACGPGSLLADHAAALDSAYHEVASRLDGDGPATVDEDGRLHLAALTAVPDPPSLVDLRRRVERMLPEIDLPEFVLEVMSWVVSYAEFGITDKSRHCQQLLLYCLVSGVGRQSSPTQGWTPLGMLLGWVLIIVHLPARWEVNNDTPRAAAIRPMLRCPLEVGDIGCLPLWWSLRWHHRLFGHSVAEQGRPVGQNQQGVRRSWPRVWGGRVS